MKKLTLFLLCSVFFSDSYILLQPLLCSFFCVLLFLFYYIYIIGGACTKEIFAKFCKKQLKKLRR